MIETKHFLKRQKERNIKDEKIMRIIPDDKEQGKRKKDGKDYIGIIFRKSSQTVCKIFPNGFIKKITVY